MAGVDKFVGNWTYRSFNNDPDIDKSPDELVFAIAELKFEAGRSDDPSASQAADDMSAELAQGDDMSAELISFGNDISGKLSFQTGLYLTVSGKAASGKPPTIRWRAVGVAGTSTAGWIYDFLGYLAPSWPKGDKQRPAIVGTVIRTVAHKAIGSDEVRPAGVTGSLIAVLRDRS